MLLKSIITEKCFANRVRWNCAHSIVPVIHWIWQTGLTEVRQCIYIIICVCVCVPPCACVAQLMLTESFCAVNHHILIVKSGFASWETSTCQRPSLFSTLPGTLVRSRAHAWTYIISSAVFGQILWILGISVLKKSASQPLVHNVLRAFLQAGGGGEEKVRRITDDSIKLILCTTKLRANAIWVLFMWLNYLLPPHSTPFFRI